MLLLLDVVLDMTEEKKILQIGFWNELGYVSRNQQIESVSWSFCISYLPWGLMYLSYGQNRKNILSFYDLGKQFIHDIHLTDEVYEKDYEDVRNKRFKSAKLAIEYEVIYYFVL